MRLRPLAFACLIVASSASAQDAAPNFPVLPPPDMATAGSAATADTAQAPASLDAAIAGDWCPEANRARDAHRHPRETLAFFGLRDDQTVIELWPGGGWYTEILAPMLRERGQYIAASPAPPAGKTSAGNDKLRARFAAQPEVFGKARLVEVDTAAPVLGPNGSADAVLTFRNVHNWVMDGKEAAMFKAIFEVLKPGGTLGVVDHRAKADQPAEAMKTSGYLPEAYVIQLAEAAGFQLAAKSEVNANPRDTADHPEGVWTLPPRLALGDKDRDKYSAIGESDRMTLRFVKPAR